MAKVPGMNFLSYRWLKEEEYFLEFVRTYLNDFLGERKEMIKVTYNHCYFHFHFNLYSVFHSLVLS